MANIAGRMAAPEKSKRGIAGVLKELFTYTDKLKRPAAAAFLLAIAGAVLTIIGPHFLGQITNLISDATWRPSGASELCCWSSTA